MKRKPLAALAIAAALGVGTAAPAAAAPVMPRAGKTCPAYSSEEGYNYVTHRVVITEWKLTNDTRLRCDYLREKSQYVMGTRVKYERANVFYRKYV